MGHKAECERFLVVTFYSFKGGVGRSTALAFVANILATEGYRVVIIDFDLEAPGLSFAYPVEESEAITCGVLDYTYQRDLTPEEVEKRLSPITGYKNVSVIIKTIISHAA